MIEVGALDDREAKPSEPWWERIRGARAISWQSVIGGNALISVAIVVSGGTLGGYAFGPDAVRRALLIVLLVGVVAAVWATFGFRVLFRHRRTRPVSLWTYFLFYAVNATFYFLGVQWLDNTSAEPSGIGWPARLMSSVAIGWGFAIAISLLLESSDRFHARRQELLDDMVTADVERLRESHEALRLREALDAQVDDVLAATRDRLVSALDASTRVTSQLETVEVDAAADIVRAAANDVVRPLSHQLHERANVTFPPPRLSGVLWQWWTKPRLPPLATALLVSSQTTAESVRNFGGALGPVASVAYFLGLYLFLLLIDRAARRMPRRRRLLYVTGVLGSLALNLGFAEGLSPEAFSAGDAVANLVVSLAYIVITSLFDANREARAGLIESLAREVNAEELRTRALNREMAGAVDALARELHGRVQTQLVVCAAELERAARVGDHEAIMRALSEAASALESATHPRTLTVNDVVSAWESVLQVRTNTSGVSVRELLRADVASVVEEGLANAHRHGAAESAFVTLQCLPDTLRVTIIDDGRGFNSCTPGLGSQLMRRLSQDRMTLVHEDHLTVLTVDLPPCIDQVGSTTPG